ncbi:MAG: Decarboxylase NovR, partial [Pseudomonadota bacterium]
HHSLFNIYYLPPSDGQIPAWRILRIANAMHGADVVFLGNHGVIVCGERVDYAYDDLYYLERACQVQVLAASTGVALKPVAPEMAARVMAQSHGERLQSELFFSSLRRMMG